MGQLLHYAMRSAGSVDGLWVLLPEQPSQELSELMLHYGFGYAYVDTTGQFVENPARDLSGKALLALVSGTA